MTTFTATMTDLHRMIADALASHPRFASRDTILAAIDDAIDRYFDDPRMTDAERAEYRNAMIHHYDI
jgi:hypothetical protein